MIDERDCSAGNNPRSETERTRRAFPTGTAAAGGVVAALSGWNTTTGAEPSKGVAVNPRLFTFVGGKAGGWSMVSIQAVVGDPLPAVDRVVNRDVPIRH